MSCLAQEIFTKLTGRKICIGIVDSGFDPNSQQVNLQGGINLSDAEGMHLDNLDDHIGHGTACAGIISKKAPEAELFAIKIFDTTLEANISQLLHAIEWCIKNDIQVINLSLGTTDITQAEQLISACDFAKQQGVIVVAATANDDKVSYPASLPSVLGVTGGKVHGIYDYYYDPDCPIQFVARGNRQRLNWINGQQVFLDGTSFAAPHITAIVALLLEKFPDISETDLSDLLVRYSLPKSPPLVDDLKYYKINGEPAKTQTKIRLSEVCSQNDIDWIQRAVLFPFNKEMHSLVRFQDLLSFEILYIIDAIGKRTIGKDCGEILGTETTEYIVQKDVEQCLVYGDTLILGYLDELSRIRRRDLMSEMLQLALKHKKHVYSLSPVNVESYDEFLSQFKEKGLRINWPKVDFVDYKSILKAFDREEESKKPIVGVFGTSPSQGKFTVQLALKQELMQRGYRVGQLGTEHQSPLFGADFTFPNGYDGNLSIQIPMDMHIPLLQSAMVGIENEDPHIVIIGSQSGIVPYSYGEKSLGYTLPALITLMGTVPDAYILVVNSIDDVDHIQKSIDVLEGVGKGKTILLAFSDKKKEVKNLLGRSYVVHNPLSDEEIQEVSERLEAHFEIPATEIISDRGRKKMTTVVENFFSSEKI